MVRAERRRKNVSDSAEATQAPADTCVVAVGADQRDIGTVEPCPLRSVGIADRTAVGARSTRELLGAVTVPDAPHRRLLRRRDEILAPERLASALAEINAEPVDPEATHPPLSERLEAVGASGSGATVGPHGEPALIAMLPKNTVERLLDELDRDWSRDVKRAYRLE